MQLISGALQRCGAGGDRDLVLARQVGVVGVAVEERRHLVDAAAVTSKSSSCASPATGQPVMLRTASPQAPAVVSPTARSRSKTSGSDAELEVVELDRLARRQLAGAAAVLVRELADRAQLLGRDPAGRQLDAEHERADLRLVVVEPPPLEPDDVLLGDVRVAGRDQRRQLVEHRRAGSSRASAARPGSA